MGSLTCQGAPFSGLRHPARLPFRIHPAGPIQLAAQIGASAGIVAIRREGTDFIGNVAPGDGLLSLPDGYEASSANTFDKEAASNKGLGLGTMAARSPRHAAHEAGIIIVFNKL